MQFADLIYYQIKIFSDLVAFLLPFKMNAMISRTLYIKYFTITCSLRFRLYSKFTPTFILRCTQYFWHMNFASISKAFFVIFLLKTFWSIKCWDLDIFILKKRTWKILINSNFWENFKNKQKTFNFQYFKFERWE